jgi:hypothetical protein
LAFALRIVVPDHLRQVRAHLGRRRGRTHPRPGQAV